MKPELRVNAGIYVLTWPDQQLRVRIDRIREDSRYQVTAEVLVQSLMPDTPAHLHQARLNLTSTTARRTLARHLEEVSGEPETGWGAIVEQACVLTLDAYREGEPVMSLRKVGPRETATHRLTPFLVEGHASMIYGPGGSGKSYLAALFAVLISGGNQHLGMYPLPGRVLYLDYETSAQELRDRIVMIENGLDDPESTDILYRFCYQPLTAEIDEIQRHVAEQEVEFVVIDSMGLACGGDPNTSESVIAYFRAVRELRATSLTIHHIAKASMNSASATPYGSVYSGNLIRSLWELRSEQEPGETTMQMGLFHRKANFGALQKPVGLTAIFGETQVRFTHSDVRDVPALAQAMSHKQRIKLALKQGELNAKQIAEETGVKQSIVRTTLNRGKGRDFTVTSDTREPTWGLLSDTEE